MVRATRRRREAACAVLLSALFVLAGCFDSPWDPPARDLSTLDLTGPARDMACPVGLQWCGGGCVTPSPATCGDCGVFCNGRCSTLFEQDSCGACGVVCPPGATCTGPTAPRCLCAPPANSICPVDGKQACVDLRSDLRNCSFCGRTCPNRCASGICQ